MHGEATLGVGPSPIGEADPASFASFVGSFAKDLVRNKRPIANA
jgi:hypothetical protein